MKRQNFATHCTGAAFRVADHEERPKLGNNPPAIVDTQVFATGHSRGALVDTDRQGSIVLNGVALSSGKQLAESDSVWWDATEKYRIARVTDTQLLITPTAGGDSITVKNWKPGDLGLALGDEVEEQEEPAPPTLYFGDQRAPRLGIEIRKEDIDAAHPSYGFYDWSAVTWQPTGALVGAAVNDSNWGIAA